MRFNLILLCLLFVSNCIAQENMEFKKWERKHNEGSLFEPFIFFVIYCKFQVDFNISKSEYRTAGIPEGIELLSYGPNSNPEVLKTFLEGYIWDELLATNNRLANQIQNSSQAYVIKGNPEDYGNLNYLRDVIGISEYLLDNGGVAIYDPQMFKFWSKKEWSSKIFEPNSSVPRNHVVIIRSEEENGEEWFHTRGLRKFGCPDISIHNVSNEYRIAVIDLINRFIEYQAFGGIIMDGQKINMESLPEGMYCQNQGEFEDPDFNNRHVEIYWE